IRYTNQTRPSAGHQPSLLYPGSSLRWLQLSKRSALCSGEHRPGCLLRNAPFLQWDSITGASWLGCSEEKGVVFDSMLLCSIRTNTGIVILYYLTVVFH